MDAHNSLKLDTSLFGEAAISEETKVFNAKLQDIMSKGPKWYEVGRRGAADIPGWHNLNCSSISTRSARNDIARCVPPEKHRYPRPSI
jgi:hypothetical protein